MESSISGKLATFGADSIKGNQILDLGYWFGYPGAAGVQAQTFLLILAGLITLVSLVVTTLYFRNKALTPPQRKFLGRVALWSWSFACLAWFLVLFRLFGVPFVSIRFLWVVWLLSIAFVAYQLLKFYSQKLPQSQVQYESYLIKRSYFPKKKKR
jgi:hypothetical protein